MWPFEITSQYHCITLLVIKFIHIAPMTPPRNIEVDRINSTAVKVTWEPLTLIEARGFITNYTVTLQPQGSRKRADGSIVVTVPHNVSDVTITGLDPDTNYIVTVVVGTSVGQLPSDQLEIPRKQQIISLCIIVPNVDTDVTSSAPATTNESPSTSIHILQSNSIPTTKEGKY